MLSMILQWVHSAQVADEARAGPQEYKPGLNHSPRPGAKKAEKEIGIANRLGLHARPAALFARSANRFRADVWLEKEPQLLAVSESFDPVKVPVSEAALSVRGDLSCALAYRFVGFLFLPAPGRIQLVR